MNKGGKNDNCVVICWGLSALAGIGVLIIAMKSMWFIVALVLGIVFAVAMGLLLQRKICGIFDSPLEGTSIGELTGLGKIPHEKLVAADMIETEAPAPAPAEPAPKPAAATPAAATLAAAPAVAATPAAAPAATPTPAAAPLPEPAKQAAPSAAATSSAPTGEGTRPASLDAPRGDAADDLKKIKGVGPKLEALLHRLGFFHFDQIANWTADEVAWVDANLEGFKGRVTRDDWVAQARQLADGGETEFSKRVGKGDVY